MTQNPNRPSGPRIADGDVSPALVDDLRRLGDEYGPTGVANAAAEMAAGGASPVVDPDPFAGAASAFAQALGPALVRATDELVIAVFGSPEQRSRLDQIWRDREQRREGVR